MIRVGIVGANGYTGLELLKIFANHSKARVVHATSRSNAGTKIGEFYPALSPFYDFAFSDADADVLAKDCDVVFTALPHAASAAMGEKLFEKGVKVIDLSADFRYNDLSVYEKTYKVTHPCPEINKKAVYGLCELYREKIKKAEIVGNPGCYTTTSILPLYPLLAEGLISEKGIIIDAKSGTSGAGRKAEVDYGFCEVTENFKAYAVTTHRHTSEIEEQLSLAAGKKLQLSFTPHLLPVKRGIVATIYADCTADAQQIDSAYEKFYKNEKFIKLHGESVYPELKWVVGSNTCHIGYKLDKRLNRIIILSATDNLLKGASGQAVQNMNIMMNIAEDEGLSVVGRHL